MGGLGWWHHRDINDAGICQLYYIECVALFFMIQDAG